MKSKELHRLIRAKGWDTVRQNGSHIIYRKNGKTIAVPFHGVKEERPGLAAKIMKIIDQENNGKS